MPNIKSQIKRVKTNEQKRIRNKAVKTNLRTSLKKADAAITAGDDKKEIVNGAYSTVDVAARKGVIHKNTAARQKAAIAKKANG